MNPVELYPKASDRVVAIRGKSMTVIICIPKAAVGPGLRPVVDAAVEVLKSAARRGSKPAVPLKNLAG
jgi:hypothetical protein